MTHYTFPIAIEREEGQYYAYSEDLPGVYGLGATIEAAKESMLEGIRLYILGCKKDGRPIPTHAPSILKRLRLQLNRWQMHVNF
jgi:predicted RNase H-like HicB family nuclease